MSVATKPVKKTPKHTGAGLKPVKAPKASANGKAVKTKTGKKSEAKKKVKRSKPSSDGLAEMLADAEERREYQLEHKTNRYGKKGQTHTRPISINHIVGKFLNEVGVGGKTTVADIHEHVEEHLGRVPKHVDDWLDQQAGGEPIGKIKIANPKLAIDKKSGKVTVLKEFKFRG